MKMNPLLLRNWDFPLSRREGFCFSASASVSWVADGEAFSESFSSSSSHTVIDK